MYVASSLLILIFTCIFVLIRTPLVQVKLDDHTFIYKTQAIVVAF